MLKPPLTFSTTGYAGSNGASSGSNQSDSDQEDNSNTAPHRTTGSKPEPVPEITITPRTPTLVESSPPQSPHVGYGKSMSFFSSPSESSASVTEPNTSENFFIFICFHIWGNVKGILLGKLNVNKSEIWGNIKQDYIGTYVYQKS